VKRLRRIVSRALWARGVFPHHFAGLLDIRARRLLLSPGDLADRLSLRVTDCVLEVGAGSGYCSVELARRVPAGALELVDIQPEMLIKARRKIDARGFTNVRYTVADAGAGLPLRDGVVDVAVLVSVLGEVGDRNGAIASLRRVLKPGGRLAVHESVPDPDRIPWKELVRTVGPNGFELLRRFGARYNYTAIFRRR
jgi:ubiquinone/menaquinone biosynthesis C-methylase UbiE